MDGNWKALLYPEPCINCGRNMYGDLRDWCACCRQLFHHQEVKLLPMAGATRRLLVLTGAIDIYALAPFESQSGLRKVIHQSKYGERPDIGIRLGNRIGQKINERNSNYDLVIPVPMSSSKLKVRGYNHASQIATGISQVLNVPCSDQYLDRLVQAGSQAERGQKDRWQNIIGAFRVTSTLALEGKHVLLVDDVITTGSTISTCCELIRRCVGSQVSIACLALA